MTKAQFIASVEAKSNFIKWAQAPVIIETYGDIEKYRGIAYISTPDGTNTFNVWFMHDIATGQASWQTADTMDPDANKDAVKYRALTNYLKSNFAAYFVIRYDLVNNWAEADVFTVSGADLSQSKVLVFKTGTNPITHRTIA